MSVPSLQGACCSPARRPLASRGALPAQQRSCSSQRPSTDRSLAAAAHANGASSNGASPPPAADRSSQHASIQHPIFPDSQAPGTAGPLLVPTQRGLPLFKPVVGDPPCPACSGLGKTTCGDCRGKGRLNYRGAGMLPTGVWPQWCPTCRASGKWCCPRCMGTGVRRQPIGFRPHDDDDDEEAAGDGANRGKGR